MAVWVIYKVVFYGYLGHATAQLVEALAISWKVAGSIPDIFIGIFYCHYTSGCNMALGSTQPSTEMSIRNISWG
jgi:hypothetical protein